MCVHPYNFLYMSNYTPKLKKISKRGYHGKCQLKNRTSGLGREKKPVAKCLHLKFSNLSSPGVNFSVFLAMAMYNRGKQSHLTDRHKHHKNPSNAFGGFFHVSFYILQAATPGCFFGQMKEDTLKDTLKMQDRKFK